MKLRDKFNLMCSVSLEKRLWSIPFIVGNYLYVRTEDKYTNDILAKYDFSGNQIRSIRTSSYSFAVVKNKIAVLENTSLNIYDLNLNLLKSIEVSRSADRKMVYDSIAEMIIFSSSSSNSHIYAIDTKQDISDWEVTDEGRNYIGPYDKFYAYKGKQYYLSSNNDSRYLIQGYKGRRTFIRNLPSPNFNIDHLGNFVSTTGRSNGQGGAASQDGINLDSKETFMKTIEMRDDIIKPTYYGSIINLGDKTLVLGSQPFIYNDDREIIELFEPVQVSGTEKLSFVNDRFFTQVTGTRDNATINIYALNSMPTVSDNTLKNKTLYEGDILTLNGNVKDEDKGDVVTLRYNINNGTTRALSSNISQGRDIPYNKTLTFKEGYLYDGSSKVSSKLSDGTKHLIKLWAEDDKGSKSNEVLINFYVVNNRPASLVINSMVEQNDLIDTDTYLITGSVKDPDGNETTLSYKVNSSSYSTINSGKDRDFEVRIPVSRFNEGSNTVTFRAKDTYGAITEKVAKITKDKNITPLKTAIREYKMLPPDGKAKGILLWIQRETGDLTTKVEIKFGSSPYKTLESDNTAPVGVGIEEDEYYYENDKEESDIRLRITMERSSLSSTKGIKLISGVFN